MTDARLLRAWLLIAATAMALLLSSTIASAAPTVLVKGRAVPIPGFPHTGNILGAGAAVEAEVKISGTEYGGFPPPLIGITVYLPRGVKIDTRDFPTCPTRVIAEEREPRKCPKGSSAGPIGTVEGVVAFGEERVEETAEIHSFFAPGGGLEFLVDGHTPVSLEIPTSSRLLQPQGGGGFGPEFTGPIPLVETVPGAADASTEKIDIKLGSAIRKHGRVYYYGTVPKSCPAGGFRVKAELTFAEGANLSDPVTVTVPFRVPCPPR
ncbi:MAG TPA: hypothetical protein VIH92_01350 [Solirubrobacteraceae bacterium]|jgi:hypothetical protein